MVYINFNIMHKKEKWLFSWIGVFLCIVLLVSTTQFTQKTFAGQGDEELTEEEKRIEEYIDRRAREQWAIEQAEDDVDRIIESMVEELLIDGFNEHNQAIVSQIAREVSGSIIDDKLVYTDVVRNIQDGDYAELGMNLARHTGNAVANAVKSGVLKTVTKTAGVAGQVAGALIEGDIQGSMEHFANYVADNSKLYGAFNIARQAVRGSIDNWTNDEIEAAYEVYRDGAERHGWLGSYSVDPGDFDAVWTQMAGAARQVEIDALENYRVIHGLNSVNDIPSEKADELRANAMIALKEQFEARVEQEHEIERIRSNQKKIIEVFNEYNMLETWRPWHSSDQPIEMLLNRLYGHIDRVLRDTGRTNLIHDRDDLVVRDDRGEYYRELTEADLELNEVVELIQIRLRDGHDAYFEELRKRGLLPEEDDGLAGDWSGTGGLSGHSLSLAFSIEADHYGQYFARFTIFYGVQVCGAGYIDDLSGISVNYTRESNRIGFSFPWISVKYEDRVDTSYIEFAGVMQRLEDSLIIDGTVVWIGACNNRAQGEGFRVYKVEP